MNAERIDFLEVLIGLLNCCHWDSGENELKMSKVSISNWYAQLKLYRSSVISNGKI